MFDIPFHYSQIKAEQQVDIDAEFADIMPKYRGKMSYSWGDRILTTTSVERNILPKLPTLNEVLTEKMNEFLVCSNLLRDFAIVKSWINVSEKHGTQNYHDHLPHDMVGIYYHQVPNKSGALVLKSDSGGLTYSNLLAHMAHRMIEPQKGDVIMFPAFVLHSVTMNQSEEERISLAFNVDVRR